MGGSDRIVIIECQRRANEPPASTRTTDVRAQFGLAPPKDASDGGGRWVLEPLSVRLGAGRIIAFTGPSGSGKSTALGLIEAQCPGGHNVGRISFPADCSIVDGVGAHGSLSEALGLLSACALGEAPLWLRRFEEMSEGERFRARLARALGLHAWAASPAPLLCDEFCGGLHRRAARAVAYNLRKLVTRRKLCVVVATGNDDLLPDLQPDTTVCLLGNGRYVKIDHEPRPRPIRIQRRLRITPGAKSDYAGFAAMHYRATDELGFVDKVFVLREGTGGDALGIVVYAHGPIELSLRNRATGGRFRGRPDLLNREVRIVRRLVIHPDVRGCGLGRMLVRRTLPRAGTRYVECLAAMGQVNPVFERAGMKRVGACPMPRVQARAMEALEKLGVDPLARDVGVQVCRRPQVRSVVAEVVRRWYRATTGGGEDRVARQSPPWLAQTFRGLIGSRPVYYLWERRAS